MKKVGVASRSHYAGIMGFFLSRIAILVVFLVGPFFAFAEDEEVAVSLGSSDTATVEASNPYVFVRNHQWVFLPLGMLILAGLHLKAYPYIRVKKQKLNLESKKNET